LPGQSGDDGIRRGPDAVTTSVISPSPDLTATVKLREVIAQAAHVEGGVHMLAPEGDSASNLTDASRYFNIGGREMNLAMLVPIARVVLKGLEPLKVRLESELASSNPGPDVLDAPTKVNKKRRRRR
jgi:hypothetical protein